MFIGEEAFQNLNAFGKFIVALSKCRVFNKKSVQFWIRSLIVGRSLFAELVATAAVSVAGGVAVSSCWAFAAVAVFREGVGFLSVILVGHPNYEIG